MMKKRISCILLALMMWSTMFLSVSAASVNSPGSILTDTVSLEPDGTVVEKAVVVLDKKGNRLSAIRKTSPNGSYILSVDALGERSTFSGRINYSVAKSFYQNSRLSLNSFATRANNHRYIGTVSTVIYIGPEYGTASMICDVISQVCPNMKLACAAAIAGFILGISNGAYPTWNKIVVSNYEVYGANGYFLGWYYMSAATYIYNHKDTTGSDFIGKQYNSWESTMPGL